MKNFFKYCLMTVLGLFGLWCIQPYSQLIVGLACLWCMFELFKSTLVDFDEDWQFNYLKDRIRRVEKDILKFHTRMV